MMFPEGLRPYLQRILDSCKGANPNRSVSNADYEMEAVTVQMVQAFMHAQGVELTYGEAFDLWGSVNADCQTSWVEANSAEGVLIELERLCEHIRDGCDYAGFSRPIT